MKKLLSLMFFVICFGSAFVLTPSQKADFDLASLTEMDILKFGGCSIDGGKEFPNIKGDFLCYVRVKDENTVYMVLYDINTVCPQFVLEYVKNGDDVVATLVWYAKGLGCVGNCT